MFYFDSINGKKVLKSSLLSNVEHFFTTKDSFIKTKEQEYLDSAKENKRAFCSYLKIKENKLVSPKQTHGANIEIASEDKIDYPDTDALILDSKDMAIYLSFADCTPVILYDGKNNIVSIIHCGWRSSAQKIAAKTVEKMQKLYNTNPKDIKAAIFPSICFKCFETSKEAIDALSRTISEKIGLFCGRYADLKGINAQQLREAGVTDIDISSYCTYCNNDLFFSYRKENKTTSRNSLIAKLIYP